MGYYRLCAYWHPFKQTDDSFLAGTTFDTVWERYTFDRQLRLTVMDAIERVEVAIRTGLVTELALRGGPFVHLDIRNFRGALPDNHRRFVDDLRDGAQRSKNDPSWHGAIPVPNGRVFAILTLLHSLLRQIAPQTGWRERLFAVFDRFPGIPLRQMGMPDSWRTHRLWQ